MSTWPIYASDNGYIVRRLGQNNWDIVYTSSLGSHALNGNAIRNFAVRPGTSEHIYGIEHNSVDPLLKSTDGGSTWSSIPWSGVGIFGIPTAYFPSAISVDSASTLYGGRASTKIYSSIDDGQHWAVLANDTSTPTLPFFYEVDNGYLWGAEKHNTPPATANLDGITVWRWDLDGTNRMTWDFINPTAMSINNGSNWNFNSGGAIGKFPGSNRVYQHDQITAGQTFLSVDLSNASGPTITAVTMPGANLVPVHVQPISNTIALMVTNNHTSGMGAIYRTTDAGASWTQVLSDTADLILSFASGAAIAVDYSDPTVLWAGVKIPHTFYSTDAGLTWTEEDYNGPSLGAGAQWMGLVAGSVLFPGQARLGAGAVEVWSRTAF